MTAAGGCCDGSCSRSRSTRCDGNSITFINTRCRQRRRQRQRHVEVMQRCSSAQRTNTNAQRALASCANTKCKCTTNNNNINKKKCSCHRCRRRRSQVLHEHNSNMLSGNNLRGCNAPPPPCTPHCCAPTPSSPSTLSSSTSSSLSSSGTMTAAHSSGSHDHQHNNNNNSSSNRNGSRSSSTGSPRTAGCRRSLAYAIAMLVCVGLCIDLTNASISNVELFIEPPAVRRGQSVTLRCLYTLMNDTLYTVKFFRGSLDFFRYMPSDKNQTVKVMQFPGIKVDAAMSNATQVVLRNVRFGLTGNFSCEVTGETPNFSTATAYAQMHVVEFPEKRPMLHTEQDRYEPGDILRANCSTLPSWPRAELRFTINNMPVSTAETQYIRTVDSLIASRLSLKMPLQAAHFAAPATTATAAAGGVAAAGANGNAHMLNALATHTTTSSGGGTGGVGAGYYNAYNTYTTHMPRSGARDRSRAAGGGSDGPGESVPIGSLLLRCTAQIGDLYQEYKEMELGTAPPHKDPVPARVMFSSATTLRNFFDALFTTTSSSAFFAPSSTAAATALQCTRAVKLGVTMLLVGALHSLRMYPAS